jgi:hypothetical protein
MDICGIAAILVTVALWRFHGWYKKALTKVLWAAYIDGQRVAVKEMQKKFDEMGLDIRVTHIEDLPKEKQNVNLR